MNTKQKIVIILIAFTLALILLFPPTKIILGTRTRGYAEYKDYSDLFPRIIAVGFVGVALFFLVSLPFPRFRFPQLHFHKLTPWRNLNKGQKILRVILIMQEFLAVVLIVGAVIIDSRIVHYSASPDYSTYAKYMVYIAVLLSVVAIVGLLLLKAGKREQK
jgi:hypothetical protein